MTEKISFRWGVPLLDGGFTQLPNHFFRVYHQIITKEEWLFICHLASYKFERKGSVARPSHATIMQEMGYKERRSIQNLQYSLMERGYLTIIPRKGKPNIYDFTALSIALMALAPPEQVACEPQRAAPAYPSTHPKNEGAYPSTHPDAYPSTHEEEEYKKNIIKNNPASGGDAAEDSGGDNGRPLYQLVDVADLADAAQGVPHTELQTSCESCGGALQRDTSGLSKCSSCGLLVVWGLGKLTGRQRDAIKKLEKPDLLVAPGDELGRRAARLWSDGMYWRSASQRATFRKLLKIKERGWFLQILSWAEGKRGITFSSFKKALNNPAQYQKWEDRQQSKPDAVGYTERRQEEDDAALAEAQALASQVAPVNLEEMGIITR